MMVSNIMVLNDLTATRRNDGARCSMRVLDGMCSHMAQPSSSSMLDRPIASTGKDDGNSSDDSCFDSEPSSPSAAHEPHPISQAIGSIYCMDDFDVLEMLGEGFFSKVLKVRHRSSSEVVVLKVGKASASGCRRAAHADAAREADMMRRLRHDNVLALRGICLERGIRGEWDMHLLVDYCAGGSLSRLILDRVRHFPWRQRTGYALDISTAMEYIHSQKVIHRDLTSMNVLLRVDALGNETQAVVADFGLSCAFPRRAEQLPQVGTTYFMSPECLKEEYYDEKSDVFSFGVILCQLIARIDADPDSGLHRTSSFGLDYVLFTPCCPPDTPLELLKLAFNSCLLDPVSRPSFALLSKSLRKLVNAMPSSPQLDRDVPKGLGRSRSDAALKRPRGMTASRKLSSNLSYASHCRPVIEGFADESSFIAMEELARNVARDEPSHDHTNPFMEHERYRKERKITARMGGRRRSETKPEPMGRDMLRAARRALRRRCTSLPCDMDLDETGCSLNEVAGEDDDMDETDGSPGGIPMAYRDYDMKFIKAMKRFPSRRHTLIPECLAVKSTFDLPTVKPYGEGFSAMDFQSPLTTTNAQANTLSPVVEKSSLVASTSLNSDYEAADVITVQPLSLSSSRSSIVSSSEESSGDRHNNNCRPTKSWTMPAMVNTVVVQDKDSRRRSSVCVALSGGDRKNQKCTIL